MLGRLRFRRRLDGLVHAQINWRVSSFSGFTVLPVTVQTFYSLSVIFPCRLMDFPSQNERDAEDKRIISLEIIVAVS